jgi:hypothetical protein
MENKTVNADLVVGADGIRYSTEVNGGDEQSFTVFRMYCNIGIVL